MPFRSASYAPLRATLGCVTRLRQLWGAARHQQLSVALVVATALLGACTGAGKDRLQQPDGQSVLTHGQYQDGPSSSGPRAA